ncbi:MAG TPA: hypothetical protein VF039_06810 [Longimicrobiales bacterium]
MDLLQRFIPDARTLALVAPAALVYTLVAAALAARLRTRGVRAPYTRKIFHFVIFTMAVAVHVVFGAPGVAVYGSIVAAAVVYATMRGDGFPFFEAMARPTDAPHRAVFVIVPLVTTALGGVLSNLLFADFAVVGYLVAGWGDAVGEPVGTRWGRHRYRVPSLAGVKATRSIEGSGAVLLCGAAAATIVLLLRGYDVPTALAVGVACGLAGAAVEAISTHGLDNLTVQLAAAATAHLLL